MNSCSIYDTIEPEAMTTSGCKSNEFSHVKVLRRLGSSPKNQKWMRTLRPSHPPKLQQSFLKHHSLPPNLRIILGTLRLVLRPAAFARAAPVRPRQNRPRYRRAPEQRDELAPFHSITSSARASSDGGTETECFGGLEIDDQLELVGCSIGRSAGFAPLRTLTTNAAARRLRSVMFGP